MRVHRAFMIVVIVTGMIVTLMGLFVAHHGDLLNFGQLMAAVKPIAKADRFHKSAHSGTFGQLCAPVVHVKTHHEKKIRGGQFTHFLGSRFEGMRT